MKLSKKIVENSLYNDLNVILFSLPKINSKNKQINKNTNKLYIYTA